MENKSRYIVTITHVVTAGDDQEAIKESQLANPLLATYELKRISEKKWYKKERRKERLSKIGSFLKHYNYVLIVYTFLLGIAAIIINTKIYEKYESRSNWMIAWLTLFLAVLIYGFRKEIGK